MFNPVQESEALSGRIITQITDALVKGELKPGEKLPPERDLAEQFNVSRTVIRDAIKTLAGRGLLQVRHGSGIFVATAEESTTGLTRALSNTLLLQGSGLRDLFEVRKVLERRAAELAAENRTPEHLERLKNIVGDARRHPNNFEVLSERDAQFHVAVAEASQNLVLVRVMLTLLDLLEKSRLESLSIPGRAQLSLTDHAKIIEEIEDGDAEGAARAMVKHLNSVEGAIMPRRELGFPR
jgi:GntR family transcriptional repressor for pyruvate dehydrogenase complex